MHDRPDHGVTMESALLISLAFHGHRRTRSAAPEMRWMITEERHMITEGRVRDTRRGDA